MTEEIKYYKEKEYPLKWIPAEEMEETPQQTITRLGQDIKQLTQWLDEARNNADFWCNKCTNLEQENKMLKDKAIHFEMANDIKKQDIDSLREANERLEFEIKVTKADYEASEQERDELKKTVENQKLEYEELQCDLSEVENACGCYQSENAKLKQENKELKEQASLYENLYNHHGELVTDYRKQRGRAILYKSFLEELLYLLKTEEPFCYCSCGDEIIDRINEVLSNENN